MLELVVASEARGLERKHRPQKGSDALLLSVPSFSLHVSTLSSYMHVPMIVRCLVVVVVVRCWCCPGCARCAAPTFAIALIVFLLSSQGGYGSPSARCFRRVLTMIANSGHSSWLCCSRPKSDSVDTGAKVFSSTR